MFLHIIEHISFTEVRQIGVRLNTQRLGIVGQRLLILPGFPLFLAIPQQLFELLALLILLLIQLPIDLIQERIYPREPGLDHTGHLLPILPQLRLPRRIQEPAHLRPSQVIGVIFELLNDLLELWLHHRLPLESSHITKH